MAEAKFSIGQVNITGYLRVIAREMTNTGPSPAESANVVYDPPQPTTRNIVISDLNPIPHQFEFYDSVDGIALGVLLASYVIDVGKIFQAIMTIYEFKVGRGEANDPAANDTEYNNTALAGYTAEQLIVTQRVVGPRSFLMGEIEVLDTGGFKFPDDSDEVFNDEDFWTVIALNLITTQDPVNITRGRFKDIIEFDDDLAITDDHYDCLLEAAGTDSDILTLTFPDLDTIPNDVAFGITTHGGLQRYVAIQLAGGDVCRFMRDSKNIFWLGKNETLYVIIKDGIMKVSDYNGDYPRVGEVVKRNIDLHVDDDESPLNLLAETGGFLLIADYPRFFYEFINKLPPAQLSAIVAGVVTDKTKFAIDLPNDRFWMCDTGGYFSRNVDPNADVDVDRVSDDRYTGTVQQDGMKSMSLTLTGDKVKLSGGGGVVTVLKQYGLPSDFVVGTDDVAINITGNASDIRGKNIAENSWRII